MTATGATPLSTKNFIYMIGICILPVGTVGFLAGFAAPYWHFSQTASGETRVHGLWVTCDQVSASLTNCRNNVVRADDWLRGVQFLQTVGVILELVACVMVMVVMSTGNRLHKRLLDFSAGFGALLAFFGSLCYLLSTLGLPDAANRTYSWAYFVNLTGILIDIMAAILITAGNPPARSAKKGDNRERGGSSVWLPQSCGGTLGRPALGARPHTVAGGDGLVDNNKTWLLPPEMYWMPNV